MESLVRPVLMRELMGEILRAERVGQKQTLRQVAAQAGISLGYLSEVERGQKEASSELLSAICQALGLPLSSLLALVSDRMAVAEGRFAPAGMGSAGMGSAGMGSVEMSAAA